MVYFSIIMVVYFSIIIYNIRFERIKNKLKVLEPIKYMFL